MRSLVLVYAGQGTHGNVIACPWRHSWVKSIFVMQCYRSCQLGSTINTVCEGIEIKWTTENDQESESRRSF